MSDSIPDYEHDFDPHNLPREILTAIGLATTCSAQTEDIVEMAIAGCLGIDGEYGAAVTTHMPAPLRDHVLRAVAEIRLDDLDALDELDVILDVIKDAQGRRNGLVHQGWCRNIKTEEVFRVNASARGSVSVDLVPVTAEGIEDDAAFIYEAGMKLMAFLMERGLLSDFPTSLRPRHHKLKAARKKRRKEGGG